MEAWGAAYLSEILSPGGYVEESPRRTEHDGDQTCGIVIKLDMIAFTKARTKR